MVRAFGRSRGAPRTARVSSRVLVGSARGSARPPRVRLGRLVLAWARWHLEDDDLAVLRGRSGAALRSAVDLLRQRFALPAAVLLAQPVDATPTLLRLDDPAGVEALGRCAETDRALTLTECPDAGQGHASHASPTTSASRRSSFRC
ncbi:lantibiotic dehydratase [Nannocystis pusilla]|uniref:lantibiotic dehydratase n=1 Tax=Nannocystis pusilla TaxID=889268 RepID=UPI003B78CB31